jgi:hypothetical protein
MTHRFDHGRMLPLRILAHTDEGLVSELRAGLIEVVFDGQSLTMSVGRYWTFMELMSNAAQSFAQHSTAQQN